MTPACHNAEDAVTISGPKEAVGKFVEKLKEEGVFARMVKTGGIAFHSKAMQAVAPQFKKRLESVSVGVHAHAFWSFMSAWETSGFR